jgi:hypothetical protein
MDATAKTACSRCKGKGFRNCARTHNGIPGLCFDCDGDGTKATQAAKKAKEKATKAVWDAYTEACAAVYKVREANGGATDYARADRREIFAALQEMGGVFTSADWAAKRGIDLRAAKIELACCRYAYPHIDPATLKADGWELSH